MELDCSSSAFAPLCALGGWDVFQLASIVSLTLLLVFVLYGAYRAAGPAFATDRWMTLATGFALIAVTAPVLSMFATPTSSGLYKLASEIAALEREQGLRSELLLILGAIGFASLLWVRSNLSVIDVDRVEPLRFRVTEGKDAQQLALATVELEKLGLSTEKLVVLTSLDSSGNAMATVRLKVGRRSGQANSWALQVLDVRQQQAADPTTAIPIKLHPSIARRLRLVPDTSGDETEPAIEWPVEAKLMVRPTRTIVEDLLYNPDDSTRIGSWVALLTFVAGFIVQLLVWLIGLLFA